MSRTNLKNMCSVTVVRVHDGHVNYNFFFFFAGSSISLFVSVALTLMWCSVWKHMCSKIQFAM